MQDTQSEVGKNKTSEEADKVELEVVKTSPSPSPYEKGSSEPMNTNSEMGFWQMTLLLVWKNYMMQCRRRPKWWLCKILFPAVFFAILGFLRIPATIVNKDINYGFKYDNDQFLTNLSQTNSFAPGLLCNTEDNSWPPGYLAIVPDPSTNPHIQSVVDIMQAHWQTIDNKSNFNGSASCPLQASSLPWTEGLLLKYFKSNDDLNKYCTSRNYGKTWSVTKENGQRIVAAAIVFSEPTNNGTQWNYEIRTNYTKVPSTLSQSIIDQFQPDPDILWQSYASKYETSGFVELQVFVDNAITEYVATKNSVSESTRSKYTYDLTRGYQVFPTDSYKTDNYWNSISFAFAWFIIFGFVYPFNQVASQLVDEKSYKTKEGLKMMGATVSTYWTAWYLWLWFEFTLIIVFCWAAGTIGQVFKYSAPGVIFLWLYMFGLSIMTFGTLISTIFDSPRTAATLCNILLVFGVLGGFGGAAMTKESQKNALCLIAPACLTVSVTSITQYETGLIGLQWSNIGEEYSYFRFRSAILMMGLDTLIYFVLTLYLDRVWPSTYGQRQPWYFLVSKSFWFPTPQNANKDANELIKTTSIEEQKTLTNGINSNVYEPVGEEFVKKGPAISIRNLKKTFGEAFGQSEVKAVNGVSLDIYEGEVFCLLGHNGAGKTTTIGMLTGLLEISEGDAFIGGKSVKNEMTEIRKSLGVCPQHDVLWPRLTCQEHLELFALLKGVSKHRVSEEATATLRAVGLAEKQHEFPSNMSGGQRRKLSLGIALIGGSKVVFLDEPTSGMDPQSRRETWNLIEKEKKNRAIVLTTHFMDEADVLGDRIAIMSTGEVRCCGSPLFLKQKFGVGYTFVVSLEVGIKPTEIKSAIDNVVINSIRGASGLSVAGGEIAYRLPFSETASFPQMFETLDAKKKELKITSYGVSVTTLEEVFMKIGEDFGDLNNEKSGKEVKAITESRAEEKAQSKDDDDDEEDSAKDNSDLSKMFAQPTFRLQNEREWLVVLSHSWAIMYKRFWWAVRDVRAMFFVIFLPCLLAALNFGVQNLGLGIDYPNLVLRVNQWYSPSTYNVPYATFTGSVLSKNELYNSGWDTTYDNNLADEWGSLVDYSINITNEDMNNTTALQWKKQLFDHRADDTRKSIHYTSVYFDPYSTAQVSAGFNLSAIHSFPTAFSMIDNWILQRLVPSVETRITTSSHPLPATSPEKVFAGSLVGLYASLTLTIALVFVPVGIVFPVVQERRQQMKHQQMVSGVSFVSYWLGQFMADFLVSLPTCALILMMVHVFDIKAYQGEAEPVFIVAMLLFLLSVLPLTYLLSLLFDSPDKAQASFTAIFILFGLVLSIVTYILMIISDKSREVGKSLEYVFRASPMYCLSHSLILISFKPSSDPDLSYWAPKITGRSFSAMAVECVVYFGLLLAVEYMSGFPSLMTQLGFNVDAPKQNQDETLDVDVLEEQNRIQRQMTEENTLRSEATSQDTVHICGLRKVYKTDSPQSPLKVAVQNLWFAIPQGQVFGFLGVNGAGKTTTLRMLTGDTHPSSGQAFIYGVSIKNQIEARRLIGYCPQFDAIFDLLTAYEHLKFYGTIKGLKGKELEDQIRVLLKALSLNKYKHRRAGTYSGGNKRKLSAAIAMIGNPPVVFLDEPSTGMDPVSRRQMWSFINTTMEGRCVILTTHSMEECEALCHRLGIMINGQLRCLGTPQHLKSRFGKGYQLDVTFEHRASAEEREQLKSKSEEELKQHFSVQLVESNENKATFELDFSSQKDGIMTLAQMFRMIENLKQKLSIVSYALNQTTLEQIFVRMAHQYGAVSEF